jgi:DNA-binding response OmpR family regulator
METILIQEPDEAILEMVTVALEIEGYRVYSLTDKNENVLELIRRHHPKLILMDCWLSFFTDRQPNHRIKEQFPMLPVIAFSCDNQIEQEYQLLGFDGYLKKPFDLEGLYGVIRKYIPANSKRRTAGEPA